MQIKYNPQTLGQLPGQPAGGESMDEALFLFKEKETKSCFSRKSILAANNKKI